MMEIEVRSGALMLPTDVTVILKQVSHGIQEALADNLAGIYPRGSLAYGDFNPATSDLDLLVVTETPVCEAEFARLAAFHRRVAESSNPYAVRMEIAYIDRAALWVYAPGRRHPSLEQGGGEALKWQEHGSNWILERWAVLVYAKPLYGPDPQTLIKPIPRDDLVRAVRDRLQDWADWARDVDDPDWLLPRSHKAYVVETMCRAVVTLETGALASKPASVAWALENLPAPWRDLAARSQAWRQDDAVDPSLNPEIRRFVLWAAALADADALSG